MMQQLKSVVSDPGEIEPERSGLDITPVYDEYPESSVPESQKQQWERPGPITDDEWSSSRLAPDCIVEKYLYADVGVLVAAGGTGKTTLILREAVHVVLGIDLYGRKIIKPGKVLFITAEDRRETLIARLREICQAMELSPDQIATTRAMVEISDLTGVPFRLTEVFHDVVTISSNADSIISKLRDDPPVLIIIDPLVSFGTGETRINDAEQGLVMAARRIVRELGCCVRYVHHTGQQAAREKLTDAYASRGGSALPDGCRMVAVLIPCTEEKELANRPASLKSGQVIKLGLPKTSYCKKQDSIWISRDGYSYDFANELPPLSKDQAIKVKADQLERFLTSQLKDGCYHTKNTLDDSGEILGMARRQQRAALANLISSRRVIDAPLPAEHIQGARKTFLCPINLAKDDGEVKT